MTYTKFLRGSEWRLWDLHIHTPETKKNDQFRGASPEEKWSNYIEVINHSREEISVVGITDYFSMENYFKFKDYIANGRITKHFDMVLPNIELRISPVSSSATPINIHCIFNPAIDTQIEARFLSKLKFKFGESEFSAAKAELIRLGYAIPRSGEISDDEAYKIGLGQYVPSITELRKIFETDTELRDNTIIVVSNKSNDGASGLRHEEFFIGNDSQLSATRWSIYQFSDAIFSSNPGDILYFIGLGPDSKSAVIGKCKSLMPCFHGCDAHDLDKVFKPSENRYCWIKADPTFEGLKQTLYEPEDRVKIQPLKPDIKNERHVISELKFLDSGNLFGNQSIKLNANLNAIIGGKSSGKSLLLYATARSIDPDQVKNASARLGFDGYTFDTNFDFQVIWRNGDIDTYSATTQAKNHKIIYIPQLYINYLVEKNNKEELNFLIKNILLQDTIFRPFYDHSIQLKNSINREIDGHLTTYLQLRAKINELHKQSLDTGKSTAIQSSIQNLEHQIEEAQKFSSLTENERRDYNSLVLEQTGFEKKIRELDEKEKTAWKILSEAIEGKSMLLGKDATESTYEVKGSIDRILDELTEPVEELVSIRRGIATDYDVLIANIRTRINQMELPQKRQLAVQNLESVNVRMAPYAAKLEGQKGLILLMEQVQQERQKLEQANNIERQIMSTVNDYNNLRRQISELMRSRIEKLQEIVTKINDTKSNIGSGITLHAKLIYKLSNFQLFSQCNKAAVSNDHFIHSLSDVDGVRFNEIPGLFAELLRVNDQKLLVGQTHTVPLRQDVKLDDILRGLVSDQLEIDYSVTYKGDDLLKMSPGKKGTVLLILFLQISSSEYPILIDQPEDNLDNRTIYELLCGMIKSKKKERQIIIVSHNANLVVATDTENVIVANQEGQDMPLSADRNRFEYVNGSIEHSFAKDERIANMLEQQGIKEHVCDILEGGDEAFKQRERKYNIR